MKVKPDERTWYQDEIVTSTGNRIQIGARQSGKTESVVQETVKQFNCNNRVVVVAPAHRMVEEIRQRVVDHLQDEHITKKYIDSRSTRAWAAFHSASEIDYDDIPTKNPDAIVIDEANHVSPELLFTIEREFSGDVLLTATPLPKRTPVELWAKHSPYWDSWQVSAHDAPHIHDHKLRDYKKSLNTEREKREIDAKIL